MKLKINFKFGQNMMSPFNQPPIATDRINATLEIY